MRLAGKHLDNQNRIDWLPLAGVQLCLIGTLPQVIRQCAIDVAVGTCHRVSNTQARNYERNQCRKF